MKLLTVFPAFLSVFAVPAWAVYAPIPEQEQGKDFTATVRAGLSHDSNIFGASTNAISSNVYTVAPSFKFNSSLSDQTFVSLSYALTLDHFDDRPGDKTLDSHEFNARLAHSFSEATSIDISDNYTITKNPESLLAGVPVNTDQSFKRNQLDARLATNAGEKTTLVVKARTMRSDYDNAALAADLDRTESLVGLEASYAILPETKLTGEYRRQQIDYRTAGSLKDKDSNFLIGGFDYAVARKASVTGRAGYEWRKRAGAADSGAPYAEFSAKFDYAEKSYLTAGYVHTFEEASDVTQYTDSEVNRLFVNVQHALSALIVASASVTYEPSTLQARAGGVDADERTTRLGAGLTYLPTSHWTVSLTFDHDRVKSDVASRAQKRQRYGLNAAFSF